MDGDKKKKKKSSFLPLDLLFGHFQDFGALTQIQDVFSLEQNKVTLPSVCQFSVHKYKK